MGRGGSARHPVRLIDRQAPAALGVFAADNHSAARAGSSLFAERGMTWRGTAPSVARGGRVLVEHLPQPGDELVVLRRVDQNLDGHAADQRAHHPGVDLADALDLEIDVGVGLELGVELDVEVNGGAGHRHVHNGADVLAVLKVGGAGLVDRVAQVAATLDEFNAHASILPGPAEQQVVRETLY